MILTELLEHVRDWRLVVDNMKKILKRDGYISLRGPAAFPTTDIRMMIFDVMSRRYEEPDHRHSIFTQFGLSEEI